MIENGEKLPIKHIDKAEIPISRSKKFTLDKVLHAPQITKNLVSISQLTSFDNIEVIFNSNICIVKDKVTGKVLLLGKLKDGLYCFRSL